MTLLCYKDKSALPNDEKRIIMSKMYFWDRMAVFSVSNSYFCFKSSLNNLDNRLQRCMSSTLSLRHIKGKRTSNLRTAARCHILHSPSATADA